MALKEPKSNIINSCISGGGLDARGVSKESLKNVCNEQFQYFLEVFYNILVKTF